MVCLDCLLFLGWSKTTTHRTWTSNAWECLWNPQLRQPTAPPAVSAPRQPDMFVVRRGLNIGNSGCFFFQVCSCMLHAKHDLARSRRVSQPNSHLILSRPQPSGQRSLAALILSSRESVRGASWVSTLRQVAARR